jgi:hypothetical protein
MQLNIYVKYLVIYYNLAANRGQFMTIRTKSNMCLTMSKMLKLLNKQS